MNRRLISLITAAACFVSGCTHPLEIKNLSQYRPSSISPLVKRLSIGVASSDDDPNSKLLVQGIAAELKKYSGEVHVPYTYNKMQPVDVVADVRITPEYKGSGANFFVNWPGFLVFAPAWNGYVYKVNYKIDVALIDGAKNEKVDEFSLPISLDVRHAAMNRTWTELSWLEVSVIAFVGGIAFTNYDPKITPKVAETAGSTIGEYVGTEIIQRLNNSQRFSSVFDRLLEMPLTKEG